MSMTRIMVAALAAIGLSMAGDGASAAGESATELKLPQARQWGATRIAHSHLCGILTAQPART